MSESKTKGLSLRISFRSVCIVMFVLITSCGPREIVLRPVGGHTFSPFPDPPVESNYGPFKTQTDDERFRSLTNQWHERLRAQQIPGGAIAVVLDGHLQFATGVGVRRAEQSEPITENTRFRVASVSKMVVAATVLALAEDGRFTLETPLRTIAPDFSTAPRSKKDIEAVTISALLTHSAAIPDLACLENGESLDTSMHHWASWPFWGPPGTFHNYSNFGYSLLADAIERVEHEDFRKVVTRRVFVPAGMKTASYFVDAHDDNVASGHARGNAIWDKPTDCKASQAAGGVIASVVDFAHFAETLLAGGGSMLSKSAVESMLQGRVLIDEPPRLTYGFGVFEHERAGLRIVEHSGFAAGFSTLVRLVPERKFAVIAFVNAAAPLPTAIADAAMSSFLHVDAEGPMRILPPPESFRAYTGLWEDTAGLLGKFVIVARNDELVARAVGDKPLPGVMRGTFVMNAEGRADYFVTRVGVAHRVETNRSSK